MSFFSAHRHGRFFRGRVQQVIGRTRPAHPKGVCPRGSAAGYWKNSPRAIGTAGYLPAHPKGVCPRGSAAGCWKNSPRAPSRTVFPRTGAASYRGQSPRAIGAVSYLPRTVTDGFSANGCSELSGTIAPRNGCSELFARAPSRTVCPRAGTAGYWKNSPRAMSAVSCLFVHRHGRFFRGRVQRVIGDNRPAQ